jgi:long-chain fatty acid transport protein
MGVYTTMKTNFLPTHLASAGLIKRGSCKFARLLLAYATFVSASHQTTRAGGIFIYEIATPDVGLASAGYAARADDASTLFKNPAGMSRVDGPQFQGGVQALYGSLKFSPDANTSPRLGTGDGGNGVGWVPGASLFVTMPVADKWDVGLGVFSYFGGAFDYGDSWVGRYYAEKATLIGVSVMPAVSYHVTDWLAIGSGLNAMYGYLNTSLAVNNLIGPDGQMTLKDHAWGFGADVGVLIQVGEQTRVGVTYLSPVHLKFEATPSFTGLGPLFGVLLANAPQLNLGVTAPQSVMLSVYHDLNEQWALMADIGWQNWSQFSYVQAGVESGGTTTINLKFQDTWHGAVGAQFRPGGKWIFSAGIAFDSSAVDNENRTVSLPVGQAWRFGLGVQYQVSHNVNIGAAETFLWSGNMPVEQGEPFSLRGRVSGSFNDAWFSFTSLNLVWRF